MNIPRIIAFIAIWVIAALVGSYQEPGLEIAAILALPLWLLYICGAPRDTNRAYHSRYARKSKRRRLGRIWGVILTVAGLLACIFGPHVIQPFNWVTDAFGAAAVIAGFACYCTGWRKACGVVALAVVVLCMGYLPNPNYRYLHTYRAYDYSRYGVKVIEDHGHYGLADRYGVILPPEYDGFFLLNRTKPYLAVRKGNNSALYDIVRHETVIPFSDNCSRFEQTGEFRFQLIDRSGKAFAEIELPKDYQPSRKEEIQLRSLTHPAENPEALISPATSRTTPERRPYRPRPAAPASTPETTSPTPDSPEPTEKTENETSAT